MWIGFQRFILDIRKQNPLKLEIILKLWYIFFVYIIILLIIIHIYQNQEQTTNDDREGSDSEMADSNLDFDFERSEILDYSQDYMVNMD